MRVRGRDCVDAQVVKDLGVVRATYIASPQYALQAPMEPFHRSDFQGPPSGTSNRLVTSDYSWSVLGDWLATHASVLIQTSGALRLSRGRGGLGAEKQPATSVEGRVAQLWGGGNVHSAKGRSCRSLSRSSSRKMGRMDLLVGRVALGKEG